MLMSLVWGEHHLRGADNKARMKQVCNGCGKKRFVREQRPHGHCSLCTAQPHKYRHTAFCIHQHHTYTLSDTIILKLTVDS